MLTFDECKKLMSRARSNERRLPGKSTVLRQIDDKTYAVRYHRTDVVTIHKNGTYTLESGGWQTVTTKARINEYSPARICQRDYVWYLNNERFKDNCCVDSQGNLIVPR